MIIASYIVNLLKQPPYLYSHIVTHYAYLWSLPVSSSQLSAFFEVTATAAATMWVVTLGVITLASGWIASRLTPATDKAMRDANEMNRLALSSWLWLVVTFISVAFLSPLFYALLMVLPNIQGKVVSFAGVIFIILLYGAFFYSQQQLRKAIAQIATLGKAAEAIKPLVDESKKVIVELTREAQSVSQASDESAKKRLDELIKQLSDLTSKISEVTKAQTQVITRVT